MATASALDSRARRAAKRVGLNATKTRWRRETIDNKGGFQVVDPYRNRVIAGDRYDMTAENVIAYCSVLPSPRPAARGRPQEARARQIANRLGFRLASRPRPAESQGGYMLVDRLSNCVVAGDGYIMDAVRVIEFCELWEKAGSSGSKGETA